MECPVCKLENLPMARKCDCGYIFGRPPAVKSYPPAAAKPEAAPDLTTSERYLQSIAASLLTIKRAVVFWLVLTIVSIVCWLFASIVQTPGAK